MCPTCALSLKDGDLPPPTSFRCPILWEESSFGPAEEDWALVKVWKQHAKHLSAQTIARSRAACQPES